MVVFFDSGDSSLNSRLVTSFERVKPFIEWNATVITLVVRNLQ